MRTHMHTHAHTHTHTHMHTCMHTHMHTCMYTHIHITQPAVVGQRAGELRLAGFESTKLMGRLEIFVNGTWYEICNDGFGARELAVACRQLGLGNGVRVYNPDTDALNKTRYGNAGKNDPVIVRYVRKWSIRLYLLLYLCMIYVISLYMYIGTFCLPSLFFVNEHTYVLCVRMYV